MIRSSAAFLILSVATLPAQGPTFVSKNPTLISIRADEVPTLLAQWQGTALAKLFADEDPRAAGELAVRYTAAQIDRQTQTQLGLHSIKDFGDSVPRAVSRIYHPIEDDVWRLLEMPIDEVQSIGWSITADPEKGMQTYPRTLRTMSCRPQFEGRWTQLFDREAKLRAGSKLFDNVANAKVGGFPAYVFATPKDMISEGSRSLAPQQWMLHLPGRFFYGYSVPNEVGTIDAVPVRAKAEVCLEWNLVDFMSLMKQTGRLPNEIRALGLDKLKRLEWSGRFVGELLYDVLAVELNGEPGGLVAALVGGKADLPAQALPDGALVQLRAAIDLKTAFDELAQIDDDLELPAELHDLALKAFDGGLAFGCCAPAPGGLIPRMYATAKVADLQALADLMSATGLLDAPSKKITYGDVEVTYLKIPNMAQGLQPAWCIVGDQLHFAGSARSLRAYLKAQQPDSMAMDVAGMPAPAGSGELMPNIDLRFDAAAIYAQYYKHWLPAFELAAKIEGQRIPMQREDLPDPDLVGEHLGMGRGVLRKDGDTYSVVQASASGGLELTALLFSWGPILATSMFDSYTTSEFRKLIAVDKLKPVYEAIERFEKREQRRPKDLAELFTAEQLPGEALLLPGDDLAEEVKLPGGLVVRSSFRYFPDTVTFRGQQGEKPALMIEVRPHRWHRSLLLADGSVPLDSYGDDATRPIDQFGKGGARQPKRRGGFEYKIFE